MPTKVPVRKIDNDHLLDNQNYVEATFYVLHIFNYGIIIHIIIIHDYMHKYYHICN